MSLCLHRLLFSSRRLRLSQRRPSQGINDVSCQQRRRVATPLRSLLGGLAVQVYTKSGSLLRAES